MFRIRVYGDPAVAFKMGRVASRTDFLRNMDSVSATSKSASAAQLVIDVSGSHEEVPSKDSSRKIDCCRFRYSSFVMAGT